MGFNSGFKGLISLCMLCLVFCVYRTTQCPSENNNSSKHVPSLVRTYNSKRNEIFVIYLLTAVVLSPGGSAHLHTNNTQNNTNNNRTTQTTTNVEECGPCPVFASFTLAFALQLRKKHGKTSVRVRKTSVRVMRNAGT